jgi:hypothetical protein
VARVQQQLHPKTNQERKEPAMKDTAQLAPSVLNQFTGSEHWYRHWANRQILFTDGAEHVAKYGGALWLLDEIVFAQKAEKAVAAEEFQVWTLKVDLNKRNAMLTCGDGNDIIVFTKVIEFTDFPIAEIMLWFTNNTIYLPSEH